MQNELSAPPTEGEPPKSVTDVVAAVLDKHTKKNRFLQNVGIKIARRRRNAESVEAELEVQRMANADLQSKMDDMSKKMQETEDARRRDQEELKEMKKKQAELEAALHRILTQN
ncbi:hypothetical protein HU200_010046 [Digitaria exilis]|uniref:Uncharacterized protein n=1 Tax=Digitaria exilis TaxID=1010633 RepID=A0A835FJ24_9POAL|nr:hypothetical protein HU200_010046 [Digitaria exilis]